MNIYTPYFYIIQNNITGTYYAGAKWAKGSDPENFMTKTGYNTSSTIVNQLIEDFGLKIFSIRKLKIFKTGEEAYSYETKFLQKINASKNQNFYNGHNNDGIFAYGDVKEKMLQKYGVENAFESPRIKEKIKRIHLNKLGVPYPTMSPKVMNTMKQNNMKKYGVENVAQLEEVQTKMKNTCIENYGYDNAFKSPIVKEKIKLSMIEKYGVENPMQSEEIKNKISISNLKKYGVKNAFESEEAKAKIADKINKKLNRAEVDIIRKYQKIYKLKFGQGWVRKSDEFVFGLLEKLISQYGII